MVLLRFGFSAPKVVRVARMFDFLARRHHQKPRTKARSSLDISAPFDFRVEAHIEPESSVKHVLNYVNYGTDRGRTRPNLLVP
ncbi:hypothetical protein ANCCAN_09825 [Ancylostoma caninum]|uniref:Uncharacterized protein n=1 Tax=Ancylostoma caninum TaxID=29170 RepID=A0A368GIK2_ANCCA|nr:hypothetical protein ANCCAN_09825 [Ancylostoma caninum]